MRTKISTEQDSTAIVYSQFLVGKTFRYLILKPGSPNDLLRCNLAVSTLDEAVIPFEAISYVWSSSVKDHEIEFGGRTLNITANLHAVLKKWRLTDQPRSLWADGICIDQDNIQEKESQVALMARIYAAAEKVLIYIGDEDNDFAEQARSMTEEMYTWIDRVILTLGDSVPLNSFPECDIDDLLVKDSRWRAVAILFKQPWSRRGWVNYRPLWDGT